MDINLHPKTDTTEAIGNPKVKEFYDRKGWVYEDGVLGDTKTFGGTAPTGEVRRRFLQARNRRICAALAYAGPRLDLVECGCGGKPALFLLPLCSHYTGVDFSATGLHVARQRLETTGVPFDTVKADICQLPFEDGRFDGAYSAHALYHIDDPEDQAAAFRQIMRIIRSGGVAVFILANPRPLLSPVRLVRRLIADTPVLGDLFDHLRRKPPLPYRPMSIGWTRRVLSPFGDVDIAPYAIPQRFFGKHVSERNLLGRLLWRTVGSMEGKRTRTFAYLSKYVQVTVRKR
jgi:SAM-dependent methyltransferase